MVQCSTNHWFWGTLAIEDLPELTITIEGKEYRVPRESLYMQDESFEGWVIVEISFIEGWEEWLFGLTFLENYYSVYDMEKSRIGLAASKTSSFVETVDATTTLIATRALSQEQSSTSIHAGLGTFGAFSLLAAYMAKKWFVKKSDDSFERADQK